MALHRKIDTLLALNPDIAVVSECAEPNRLSDRSSHDWIPTDPVWIGDNPNKGLGMFAFKGFSAQLAQPHFATLRYIAPTLVNGPPDFALLAVWAQNASGGVTRKHQLGPLRRALGKYRGFLSQRPTIIAGDFNNNAIWDRPGWRINHMAKVAAMEKLGLVSAYHELRRERHGKETTPTHYWRDRRKDGPTYHIDYVFLPRSWIDAVRHLEVGTFEDWCGSGLSDHVPIIVDLEI